MKCGCIVKIKTYENGMMKSTEIEFCPLHDAAEKLLYACKCAQNVIRYLATEDEAISQKQMIDKAILNAERTPDEPNKI